MKTKAFLHIEPRRRHLYEEGPHFGDKVALQFPGLTYNINEAAKCLALGRWTASAYHSLLCLEGALRGLTRCLGIPDPTTGADRNWSAVGRSVGAEMKRRWPTAADRATAEFTAFDRIFGALQALQNPYRNETMHLSAQYGEEEAAHIFEMVKGLLQRAADKCDEMGNPKLP
ncbi:MAG: hypothetical protein U1C74_23910 [Phenylobacterium sp.]|nr:hypothetical protein [Phenylobacterium sp.]